MFLSIFWYVSCFIYCVSDEISCDVIRLYYYKLVVVLKECILRILFWNGVVYFVKINNKIVIFLYLVKLNVI